LVECGLRTIVASGIELRVDGFFLSTNYTNYSNNIMKGNSWWI